MNNSLGYAPAKTLERQVSRRPLPARIHPLFHNAPGVSGQEIYMQGDDYAAEQCPPDADEELTDMGYAIEATRNKQ